MRNTWLSDEKAFELAGEYGTPLYVYDEKTLRKSCGEMRGLLPGKNFRVSYSAKANSNIELLKIIREEGLDVDAMSPGEIFVQQKAGFKSEQIFFVSNNATAEELLYAAERGVVVSVDSLSQLELFGKLNPGGNVAIRLNPSVGLGHHSKVITGGKLTKFGIQMAFLPQIKELLAKYRLNLVGVNHHLGSLFLEKEPYLAGAAELLEAAKQFPGLSVIDFGGGLGVPYREEDSRLDLAGLSAALNEMLDGFLAGYDNKDVLFRIEPGRYVAAECGVLLGSVNAVKTNYEKEYIGTDLGFNVLMRPVLYDSYHPMRIVSRDGDGRAGQIKPYTVVGNICEGGDILARDRELPQAFEGDLLMVLNAGAYGFSMSSNYNQRLRPAEALVNADGTHRLIRRRDTLEDLIRTSV